MFGYITVNKQELKFKEFDLYRSYYCGLCRTLREKYGFQEQFALTYDCTFLIMFLSGLYEPEELTGFSKCILHPKKGTPTNINKYTEYAADMTVLFTYYKCMDDWDDERKGTRYVYAKLLKKGFGKVQDKYPEKCAKVKLLFDKISECEQASEENLDKISGLFGEVLAECFCYREDEWQESISRMAFFLGKFVYLMDAYEDLDKDLKKGNYNPFYKVCETKTYEQDVYNILYMMMTECAKEFEKLPIIKNVEILRNILYSGVWCRYEMLQIKKKEREVRDE